MSIAELALAPTTFIQFTNPRTGELHFKRGEDGKPDPTKPVGVRCYTPGSKESRAADQAIAAENLRKKVKTVTPELVLKMQAERLARVTYEFVNFDYEGQAANVESCRAFYSDPTYVALKDQVVEGLGDMGAFLAKDSAS